VPADTPIYSPQRLLLRTALISAPLGALLGFMFDGARINAETPRALVHGALIAMTAALCATGLEIVFHQRLERMPPVTARVARIVLFTFAGCFGYLVGGGFARMLLWNVPFFQTRGGIVYPMVISSITAGVLGLAFYTYERLKDNLRRNIVQLKEQEFAGKELELARSIQQRLLPPQEISGDGYRIAARNLAARFVAGDFYDVFRLSDGSVGIVVADVAGKGIGASLIMASAKAVLPLIAEGRSVAEAMRALNEKLSRELGRREFVALAYARYDPHNGSVQLANAGLPDPYIVRADGGPIEALTVPGDRLPLGAMKTAAYESASFQLAGGDRLLLFTDGLPEATLHSGETLGYERLPSFLSSDHQEPSAWLDAVFSRIRDLTAEAIEDDWTALVIERNRA
jgi:sigma-B regulation protein RsbU (phosphoserine phosphatase)